MVRIYQLINHAFEFKIWLPRECYLKFEFRTAKIRPLFLPEVVRLDYQSDVDTAREGFLQDLQQRLDGVPLGATHVHNHCKTSLADLFTIEEERG